MHTSKFIQIVLFLHLVSIALIGQNKNIYTAIDLSSVSAGYYILNINYIDNTKEVIPFVHIDY